MKGRFPLPFQPLRTLRGGGDGSYVIAAMFTNGYQAQAERLAGSCDRLGLTYELHEIAAVHNSISVRGSDDAGTTKPNFIRHLLDVHRKPVLYLDADCEILSPPVLIDELVRSRRDFAIFNWCADGRTDRFVPIVLSGDEQNGLSFKVQPGEGQERRYYLFVGCFEGLSDQQLVCSGLAQFYGNSLAARLLLRRWHHTILNHPGCADDQALDFTFNNLAWPIRLLLKPQWLPKSYARISWWIHDQPVINHAGFPSPVGAFKPLEDRTRKRFYPSRMTKRRVDKYFPRECIIDTREGLICKLVDGKLVTLAKTEARFWL